MGGRLSRNLHEVKQSCWVKLKERVKEQQVWMLGNGPGKCLRSIRKDGVAAAT